MLDKLNEIEKAALESLESITDQAALDAWRIANIKLELLLPEAMEKHLLHL